MRPPLILVGQVDLVKRVKGRLLLCDCTYNIVCTYTTIAARSLGMIDACEKLHVMVAL